MKDLHDRINRVFNTDAFDRVFRERDLDLFEFQCSWHTESKGVFENLKPEYQEAILAGEQELEGTGILELV